MGIPKNHPAMAKLLKLAENGGQPKATKPHKSEPVTVQGQSLSQPKQKKQRVAGTLNETEKAFLELALTEWTYVLFERIVIPINKQMRCEYTPDALCLSENKPPRFVEVKGSFWRDDARVKTNIAGRLLGTAELYQAVKESKKKGGQWKIKAITGKSLVSGNILSGEEALGINIHFPITCAKSGNPAVRTLKVWSEQTEFPASGGIIFHITHSLLAQAARKLWRNTKKVERERIDPRAFQAGEIPGLLRETLPQLIQIKESPEEIPASSKKETSPNTEAP
jgi:hypothetical protein